MRIPAVDDNVARFKVWRDGFNKRVNGAARLDHAHHLARFDKGLHKRFNAVTTHNVFPGGAAVDKIIHLAFGTVETGDRKPLALHVENQVFTHHRQPDNGNIGIFFHVFPFQFIVASQLMSDSCLMCVSAQAAVSIRVSSYKVPAVLSR